MQNAEQIQVFVRLKRGEDPKQQLHIQDWGG